MALAVVLCTLAVAVGAVTAILLLKTSSSRAEVGPILLDEALDPDLRRLRRLVQSQSALGETRRWQLARFILEQANRRVGGTTTSGDRREVRRLLRALHSADPPSALDRQGWHG